MAIVPDAVHDKATWAHPSQRVVGSRRAPKFERHQTSNTTIISEMNVVNAVRGPYNDIPLQSFTNLSCQRGTPFVANVVVPDANFGRLLNPDTDTGLATSIMGMLKRAVAGELHAVNPISELIL